MHASHKLAITTTVALALSCGPSSDFRLHDTRVVVDSTAPFATRPDLRARMDTAIGAALAYWGGTWRDLAGSTITLVDTHYLPCGKSRAAGCYDGDIRIATRNPSVGTWRCVEQTVLVHEVGHAVIGDPHHMDPRWMGFRPVFDELAGRTGYDASGETRCVLYLSVWREAPTP